MRVADGDGVQMDGRWKTLLRPRGFRLRHYTLHRDYAGPPPKECEGRQVEGQAEGRGRRAEGKRPFDWFGKLTTGKLRAGRRR
jgi:hypothetical protein